MRLAAAVLFVAATILVILAIGPNRRSAARQSAQTATLPVIARLCEDGIGKVRDYSILDPASIPINPPAGCFGPMIKFPRTWQRWIMQETGATHPGSWLAAWPDGAIRPLSAARSGDFTPWSSSVTGNAMRFAGQGKYLAIVITRNVPSTASAAPSAPAPIPSAIAPTLAPENNGSEDSLDHPHPPARADIRVGGNGNWTDSGLNVRVGDTVTVLAGGLVKVVIDSHIPRIPPMPPAGYQPSCTVANRWYGPFSGTSIRNFPALNLPCWSLIGRVGTQGTIFEIGPEKRFHATASGELYLGINDDNVADNSGAWTASIAVRHD
jgi:hypothetical protein